MGTTLTDKGKLEEAIEAFTKALSIQPDAWNNLYFASGNKVPKEL